MSREITGLEIAGLTRRFGRVVALERVALSIAPQSFVALLGPSGSGKSTLLRILGGLDFPDAGQVWLDGRDITRVPARERGVGFVFQSYALFRHLTAAQNIAFGLSVRPRATRPSRAAIADRVQELLALVQLEGLGHRFPDQLSGGQRQRVALARALAIEPSLLLLDEPFGALDAKGRKELRRWLRALHEQSGVTTILVTHDQEEAMELADRVAVLRDGRIEQEDTPQRLYDAPASPFVHTFLGDSIRLPCEVRDGAAHFAPLPLPPFFAAAPDGPAEAYARPSDIALAGCTAANANAVVESVHQVGPALRVTVRLGRRTHIEADLHKADPAASLRPGDPCRLTLRDAKLFPIAAGAGAPVSELAPPA